jgi:nitrogen fixation protein FixH
MGLLFGGNGNPKKRGNTGRNDAANNTRKSWWNSGHVISNDDHHNSMFNLGLSGRERRALARENSRPWGQSTFASKSVSDRAKEAQRRAKSKAKGRKPVEKREGPFGMQRVTKQNKGWFSLWK